MLLGDLGATVLKVERPGTGDDTRTWGPPFLPLDSKDDTVSTYFLSVNRNKRSIVLDLKTTEGRDLCHRLAVEWADVVVENFQVGSMEKYGMGYDTLARQNPGLIYCSISGFGSTGPLKDRPGYDVIVSGMYGLMGITGYQSQAPAKVGVALTDVLTGSLAQGGILTALYERHSTGYGKKVETSLMETQLAALVNIASSTLNSPSDVPPQRWGTSHPSIVPYQAFQCQCGGHIVIGANNNTQFQDFCKALDQPDLAKDARFETNAKRVEAREILIPILENIFLQKTRANWESMLDNKGFAVGPVRTVQESFDCEQAKARNMVITLDHPVAGQVLLPNHSVKYSQSPLLQAGSSSLDSFGDGMSNSLPPPLLGQHTAETLMEVLGLTQEEVTRLEFSGAISCLHKK
jgi:crotonobetainyl-CoA:carnitine CoA-transferase CaiB-like acyl-CoA transferase